MWSSAYIWQELKHIYWIHLIQQQIIIIFIIIEDTT